MRTKLIAAAVGIAVAMAMGVSQLAFAQDKDHREQGDKDRDHREQGDKDKRHKKEHFWNPVKEKMLAGERVVGYVVSDNNNATYCSQASQPDADFTWVDMQHPTSGLEWDGVWSMMASASSCPTSRAMAGARVIYAQDERDFQHALDGGAMVLVVPLVETETEAKIAVQEAYFPPFGQHSYSTSVQAPTVVGNVPGGYRKTFNDNLVLIASIETIKGVRNADKIAAVPGIDALFVGATNLTNFSGYNVGDHAFEGLVREIRDAAERHHKRLCGPLSFEGRPDFTCFMAWTPTVGVVEVSMGPEAMGGDLKVNPGDTLSVGFDFKMPGDHPTASLYFNGGMVAFQAQCVKGGSGGTINVPIPTSDYTDPARNSGWMPSGDEDSPRIYQGSIQVPDLCAGGQMTLKQGGTFSAQLASTDTTDHVNVRWHYSANDRGGGWSRTATFLPAH